MRDSPFINNFGVNRNSNKSSVDNCNISIVLFYPTESKIQKASSLPVSLFFYGTLSPSETKVNDLLTLIAIFILNTFILKLTYPNFLVVTG